MADAPATAIPFVPPLAERDDEFALLRQARIEPASLAAFVAQHQDRVARLVYRLLGGHGEAEDVVQDVFLAALRKLPEFRGEARFSTWLTAIAVNICRSRRRARWLRWRPLSAVAANAGQAPALPAEQGAVSAERLAQVRAAVRELPAKYREVIVLRYLEDLPAAEVAAVLGLTTNTVAVRLNRARAKLRDVLADIGD